MDPQIVLHGTCVSVPLHGWIFAIWRKQQPPSTEEPEEELLTEDKSPDQTPPEALGPLSCW